METKQSSIEWLMPKILELNLQLSLRRISQRNCELEILRLFDQAKEMHKQEIIEAYKFGISDEYVIGSQQYYNETFGK